MPGGRPPKPIEVKRRNGNPGKRKLPTPGVAIEAVGQELPPVPMTLQVTGRAAWMTVWTGGRAWLAPGVDIIRVETVCRLCDEIAMYREHVMRLGPILEEPIMSASGKIADGARFVPNPAVKMLRDAEKQLDRELSALAFDPSSRSKLGLVEVKKRSILETLGLGPQRATTGTAEEVAEIVDAEVIDIAPDA